MSGASLRTGALGFVAAMVVSSQLSLPVVPAQETGIATGTSLLWTEKSELATRLDDIENIGATWVRVEFRWPDIQPDNTSEYNWQEYDRVIQAVNAHHLKVLAVLDYTPGWAQTEACQKYITDQETAQTCSPRSNAEFGNFAGMAAQRYGSAKVHAWEIWNEPNLLGYWKSVRPDGSQVVDPVAYAKLANAAAQEIRKHTTAHIVTGGLSPLFEPSETIGMKQSDYLAKMLPYLSAGVFSGISIHPYTWPLFPSREELYNAFYTVDNGDASYNLQAILKTANRSDLQIWGTEYGASTVGRHAEWNPETLTRPDHVDEDSQALMISQGISSWFKKENVGPLFVHSDSDQWLSSPRNEGGFGLKRSDGTKKPAYWAYRSAVNRLRHPHSGSMHGISGN